MKHDFSDRYYLITGAGRGLGRHLAETLAGFGATVGVADIDAGGVQATVAAIAHAGGNAFAYPGDAGNRDAFLATAADFAGQGGRIDAIVNNAMILHYSPIQATVLPCHPPSVSRTVSRSASTWQGCSRSVRPLITGMEA